MVESPEKVIVPEELTAVAPVIAPVAEILTFGVVKKLLNPVPNEMPLIILLLAVVAFAKLIPVMMFAPTFVLAVPIRLILVPVIVAAVEEVFEFVALRL